jgi:hypothetical protein
MNHSTDHNTLDVNELQFDEEIVLDYTSMPEDDTEGAQFRDITLSEMLYNFEDMDEDCELASNLLRQGL